MNSRIKVWLGLLLKLSISGAILHFIFTQVPFVEIAGSLREVNSVYLLLGFLLVPFMALTAAAQQKVLTDRQGLSLSVAKIAEINVITSFYSLFIPGYLAGGVRWYKMTLKDRKPVEALAAIAFNRMLETLMMYGMGILFWFAARPPGTDPRITVVLAAGLALLLAAQFLLFNRHSAAWLHRAVEGRWGSRIPARLRQKVTELATAAGHFDTLRAGMVAYMVGLSLARHLLGVVCFVWLALSIGIDLSFATAGWIRSFLALALMLPISFAGLGVREISLVMLLQMYGVSATNAVALSLLFFLRELLRAGVGGLLELKSTFLPTKATTATEP